MAARFSGVPVIGRGWLAGGLLAAMLSLGAPPARALEGLYLTWNDCALPGGGSSVQASPCDSDLGASALICALTAPAAIDSILGVEIVVDIQHQQEALPDWWRFDLSGCHAGELSASSNFGSFTLCQNLWQVQTSGGLQSYTLGLPHGQSNQARIRIAFGVPPDQRRAMNATDMYYAARILLSNAGSSLCEGCDGAACLVLNSILIRRPPRPEGAPSGDLLVTAPGPGGANWAVWQRSGASCQAVPVRKLTWGAVKSLYR